jgi:hypothetical protein
MTGFTERRVLPEVIKFAETDLYKDSIQFFLKYLVIA